MATNDNPYVGPRSFEREDQKKFFGRDREAKTLLSLVLSQRLVLFYAQSGAGKSSLLKARLIPDLEEEGFSVLPIGRVGFDMRETNQDSDNVSANNGDVKNIFISNLLLNLDPEAPPRDLAPYTLANYLKTHHAASTEAILTEADTFLRQRSARVLIIDQFEEIVTTHLERWEERRAFFVQLAQALREDSRLWVVLTLREDHVAALDPYARLLPGGLRTRYYMQRMRAAAAQEAIEEPARRYERPFAPGAAQKLVEQLQLIRTSSENKYKLGEFVEPVQLQVVCFRLWEDLKKDNRQEITKDDVENINVDDALAEFYEEALSKVSEQTDMSEADLRSWFRDKLITEEGTRGTVYRGKKETAGLNNEAVRLLADRFFLLRAEIRRGQMWYELVHDSFVTPILESNRKWDYAQPLFRAAKEWERSGKDESFLLDSQQLKDYIEKTDRSTLNPIVLEFLEASEDFQTQRELNEARAKAKEEAQRAEEKAKTAHRLKRATLLLIIALLVVMGATGWALYERSRVQGEANAAATSEAEAILSANLAATSEAGAVISANLAATSESDALVNANLAATNAAVAVANENLAATRAAESDANANLAATNEANAEANANLASTRQIEAELSAAAAATAEAAAIAAEAESNLQRQTSLSLLNSAGAVYISDAEQAALLAVEANNLNAIVEANQQAIIDRSLREVLSREFFSAALPSSGTKITALAASQDGRTLFVGGQDGTIQVWNLHTSTKTQTLQDHDDTINDLSVNESGNLLASASSDGSVRIWNISGTTVRELDSLHDHSGAVLSVDFYRTGGYRPDLEILASGGQDKTVRLWDVSNPANTKLDNTYREHENPVFAVRFSGVYNNLITVSKEEIFVRSASNPPNSQFLYSNFDFVNAIAISPNGLYLAAATADNKIRVWRIHPISASSVIISGHTENVEALTFQDNETLISASGDRTIRIWDILRFDTLDPRLETILTGHEDDVKGLALINENGQPSSLASSGLDETIRLWRLANPPGQPEELMTSSEPINAVAFSPDTDLLMSAGADTDVHPWLFENNIALEKAFQDYHSSSIQELAFSPDGSLFASTSVDWPFAIKLWDTAEALDSRAYAPTAIRGHSDIVTSIAFNHDNELMVSASMDGTVLLQDISNLEDFPEPVILASHTGPVYAVAISHDSQYLVTAGDDQIVRLWNISDAKNPNLLEEKINHEGAIKAAAFNADGTILATAGDDKLVLLWNVSNPDSPQLIQKLDGHQEAVNSLDFSPDGTLLASASDDGTIQIWDTSNLAANPVVLAAHDGPVMDISFSRDGKTLASVGEDGALRLWVTQIGDYEDEGTLIYLACHQVRRNLTIEEWEQFLPGEEYRQTCPNLPPHPSAE